MQLGGVFEPCLPPRLCDRALVPDPHAGSGYDVLNNEVEEGTVVDGQVT